MFQLSSYLLRPEITITNLEDASMHPEKYFVNINKVLEIRRIFPKLDSNYLNGAILIQFGDEIILDFKFWDLVDQLWGYFLNALDDLRNKGKASFYFPDQPIFIEIRNLSNAVILFSVDKKKWALPRDDRGKKVKGGDEWTLDDIITNDEHDGGLKMGVYSRTVDGTTEYALVNKGTSVLKNWRDNFAQPPGMSADMIDSIQKSEYFVANHKDNEITMVGHSKGGAEATANAVANNKDAITFNPAKANLWVYGYKTDSYTAAMTHYVVSGEALNKTLGEPSIGNVVYLPKVYNYTYHAWYSNGISDYINELFDNHSMGAVILDLQEEGYKY